MRLTISHNDKLQYYIVQQPKLYEMTKQKLYKLLRKELSVTKIHIRRNSIVCIN